MREPRLSVGMGGNKRSLGGGKKILIVVGHIIGLGINLAMLKLIALFMALILDRVIGKDAKFFDKIRISYLVYIVACILFFRFLVSLTIDFRGGKK